MNLSFCFSIVALTLSFGAYAGDKREIPTAPAEYLSMKNPMEGKKDAMEKGEKLYQKRCEKCHGVKGDGLGKSAKDLSPPVASFINGYLKNRKDGQLFWIIEKGSANTDMDSFGPGTNYNMSQDEIWSVISYMKNKFK